VNRLVFTATYRRGWLPSLVAGLACVCVASALGPAASVAASPVKDPNTIGCPAAPAGWTDPPVVKTLATPQSVPQATAEEHFATGGNLVSVNCTYHATSDKPLTVTVSYALPADVNPVNDFYWGCGNLGMKWDESYRVYRVSSLTQWASATFVDAEQFLQARDVAAFENVTRQLLQSADGYGHACDLKAKPTELKARYSFDFRLASGGRINSVFWTEGEPSRAGILPIVQATATNAALKVKANGKRRALTIKLTRGIDYRPAKSPTAGRIRFSVQVVDSKVPSCPNGSTGTLTILTSPSVLLEVCKQTFLRGERVERIRIGA
jgi:hypothetical protein